VPFEGVAKRRFACERAHGAPNAIARLKKLANAQCKPMKPEAPVTSTVVSKGIGGLVARRY
jgi:hypothetical protein